VGEAGVLGALTVVSVSRAFEQSDVSFAERLAGHAAAVVDNARRYEATLQTSQVLQQSLLPQSLPNIPGLTVAFRYLPATRGLEVGGDFYDLVRMPDGRACFAIGDVAGHDRKAAALIGQLRSATRVLLGQVHHPGELIVALRRSWSLLGFDRIATAMFALLDPASGELLLASAGHEQPLLVEPGATRYLPVAPTPVLGVPGDESSCWGGTLLADQVLVLFTDGAVEERTEGVIPGLERLARAASEGALHPEAVCDPIVSGLPAERHDDVCLLALALHDAAIPL
jgi:serine/threonine-protein kinase RsbW